MNLLKSEARKVRYDETIESSLEKIEALLKSDYLLSKRAIGLLLLQGDTEIQNLVKEREGENYKPIEEVAKEIQSRYRYPLNYVITKSRYEEADKITARVLTLPLEFKISFSERLSRIMMNPITGIPILFIILYFGLYQFVGVFGAQVLVNFFENVIFGEYINPFINNIVAKYIPYIFIQGLFAGDYGIITLGVRYAVALILPIVSTFFIAFSIMEDTGYFPRLAMLIDRLFKSIGLSGRAVIPMVLGFGCDTMATMVTRVLETKREKVIATLLLALAIPCSAQLGVILAILSSNPKAFWIWAVVVILIFLAVGYLTSKIMPGEKPSFYMEIPPLRMPILSNVLTKTYTRVEWYFMEVFPLFILASILIWMGQITGLFNLIVKSLEPLVNSIGLPDKAALVFLFGFFRRDYGAAGLYDLQQTGILSGVQLAVSAVTLTLFVPCIAQFSMMVKERGIKTAIGIALFIFPFAFLIGFMLNIILTTIAVLT